MSCNEQCPFQRLSSASGRLHQCVDHARKDDKNQHESLCTVQALPVLHLAYAAASLGTRCMLNAWQERGYMLCSVGADIAPHASASVHHSCCASALRSAANQMSQPLQAHSGGDASPPAAALPLLQHLLLQKADRETKRGCTGAGAAAPGDQPWRGGV